MRYIGSYKTETPDFQNEIMQINCIDAEATVAETSTISLNIERGVSKESIEIYRTEFANTDNSEPATDSEVKRTMLLKHEQSICFAPRRF